VQRLPAIVCLVLSTASACGLPRARQHQNHPLPLPADQVQSLNTGDAVVSYLRQRDADPAICNPVAAGPHVVLQTPRDIEDLVDGIGRGARPGKWADCVLQMLGKMPDPLAAVLLDRLLHQYVLRIAYPSLEGDAPVMQQLEILRRVYTERQPGKDASRAGRDATLAALHGLDETTLSAFGRQARDGALTILFLEQGLLPDGTPVSVESLDELLSMGAEEELRIYARRIPDPALRTEAARRLVRLRIASSPFAELRQDAAAVETRVMAMGRNPVPLSVNRPTEVDFDASAMPVRGISILQDVGSQTARLASWRDRRDNVSVVPAIDLRPVLSFTIPSFSAPLRLCAPAEELRVEPCVEARELSLGLPFAQLEDDGRFRLAGQIDMAQVLSLAESGPGFRIPIVLGGEPLVDAIWDVDYATTGNAVFSPGYGAEGPTVSLVVDATDTRFHHYVIRAYEREYHAVVEPGEMGYFAVVAAGGDGVPGARGQDGYDGSDGANGSNASCPNSSGGNGQNGSDGGPGGPGGPGGNGGPGGFLDAKLLCDPARCQALAAELHATLAAPGGSAGAGGAGGAGGRGGDGGSGGSSASCTDDEGQSYTVSGGSDGADGHDGPPGPRGPDGYPGPPGRVALDVQAIAPG
jgi:hypothetical protein